MTSFFQKGASTLRKEIALIITIKLIAIVTLWLICFSNPVKHHLTTQLIQQHLLGDKR